MNYFKILGTKIPNNKSCIDFLNKYNFSSFELEYYSHDHKLLDVTILPRHRILEVVNSTLINENVNPFLSIDVRDDIKTLLFLRITCDLQMDTSTSLLYEDFLQELAQVYPTTFTLHQKELIDVIIHSTVTNS